MTDEKINYKNFQDRIFRKEVQRNKTLDKVSLLNYIEDVLLQDENLRKSDKVGSIMEEFEELLTE